MDGKLNRFTKWIDSVIESNDVFFSEDIDWFIDNPCKSEWILLGFSLWSLTKEMLRNKGVDYVVEVGFSLADAKTPNNIPRKMTDRLFRDVMSCPTIYITKDKEYIDRIYFMSPSPFRELSTSELGLPCNCRAFYLENKEEYENREKVYYRHIMIM